MMAAMEMETAMGSRAVRLLLITDLRARLSALQNLLIAHRTNLYSQGGM